MQSQQNTDTNILKAQSMSILNYLVETSTIVELINLRLICKKQVAVPYEK